MEGWSADRVPKPHVLCTVPCGQNPTGPMLTVARRRRIHALAQKFDLVIIEVGAHLSMAPEDWRLPSPPWMSMDACFALIPSARFLLQGRASASLPHPCSSTNISSTSWPHLRSSPMHLGSCSWPSSLDQQGGHCGASTCGPGASERSTGAVETYSCVSFMNQRARLPWRARPLQTQTCSYGSAYALNCTSGTVLIRRLRRVRAQIARAYGGAIRALSGCGTPRHAWVRLCTHNGSCIRRRLGSDFASTRQRRRG